MTTDALLSRLDACAAKATPGPWETSGAVVVWSPSAKAVVAGASALRASRSVEYSKPTLGEIEQPAMNADLIAACDPATIRSLIRCVRALRPIVDGTTGETINYAFDGEVGEARKALAELDALAARGTA